MTLDSSLLRRATLVNLERLARSLGIDTSEKEQWPDAKEWRAVLERYVLEAIKVDRMRARVARYNEKRGWRDVSERQERVPGERPAVDCE